MSAVEGIENDKKLVKIIKTWYLWKKLFTHRNYIISKVIFSWVHPQEIIATKNKNVKKLLFSRLVSNSDQ